MDMMSGILSCIKKKRKFDILRVWAVVWKDSMANHEDLHIQILEYVDIRHLIFMMNSKTPKIPILEQGYFHTIIELKSERTG